MMYNFRKITDPVDLAELRRITALAAEKAKGREKSDEAYSEYVLELLASTDNIHIKIELAARYLFTSKMVAAPKTAEMLEEKLLELQKLDPNYPYPQKS